MCGRGGTGRRSGFKIHHLHGYVGSSPTARTNSISWLNGPAQRRPERRDALRHNLLATLRAREIERIGGEMVATKNLPFRVATDGETVSGKFTGTVQLSSGKFAVVEQSHEFTLVPWRPVIDRQLGKEISGIVHGGSVSWQLGRQRGIGL